MKADILALKTQLRSLQNTKPTFKLSERTVVDIIQKVIKRGNVKLLHTATGREFLTEGKLLKEMTSLVTNFGVISKQAMVNELELDRQTVDSFLNQLTKQDLTIQLIDDKLVTADYLIGLTQNINSVLIKEGKTTFSEIASYLPFSIEFIRKFVSTAITNGNIKAEIHDNVIYTSYFIDRETKRVRPALVVSTSPVTLASLVEKHHLDENLIQKIVKHLIDNKTIKGKLQQNTYVPDIYAECQRSYVQGALEQMNYVELISLNKIGITDPKSYIKGVYGKKGIYLKEVYIAESFQSLLEDALDENCKQNKPLNFNEIMYFNMEDEDIISILEGLKMNSSSFVVKNKNLVPLSLVADFEGKMLNKVKEEAAKRYNEFTAIKKKLETEEKTEPEAEEEKTKKKKGKAKEKKKEAKTVQVALEFPEDLRSTIKREFATFLGESNLNEPEETAAEIYNDRIKDTFDKLYLSLIADLMRVKNTPSTDPKKLENQINTEYVHLMIAKKHIEKLQQDGQEMNSLLKLIATGISKKQLTQLFNSILTYQFLSLKYEIDFEKLENPNLRKENLLRIEDKEVREVFTELANLLQKKDFISFMNYLASRASMLSCSLQSVEKKFEKQLVIKEIEKFKSTLSDISKADFNRRFHVVATLFLLEKGIVIPLNPEVWTPKVLLSVLMTKGAGDAAGLVKEAVGLLDQKEEAIESIEERLRDLAVELEAALKY